MLNFRCQKLNLEDYIWSKVQSHLSRLGCLAGFYLAPSPCLCSWPLHCLSDPPTSGVDIFHRSMIDLRTHSVFWFCFDLFLFVWLFKHIKSHIVTHDVMLDPFCTGLLWQSLSSPLHELRFFVFCFVFIFLLAVLLAVVNTFLFVC